MNKRFNVRNTRGDTIVEILIVLAVLGLAFAISYATASRGLIQSRTAEEHSEALGLLNGQVELLRHAISQDDSNVTNPTQVFCMDDTKGIYVGFGPGYKLNLNNFPVTAALDSSGRYTEYPNSPTTGSCQSSNEPFYESIVYVSNGAQSYYDLRIRWDGLGTLGPQQEEINYKITNAAVAPATGFSWFIFGAAFNHSGAKPPYYTSYAPGPTTCTGYGDDSWTVGDFSDSENFCDPPGPGHVTMVNDCNATIQDSGTNGPPVPATAVFMRRASLVTYNFSQGTPTGTMTAGTAYLTVNFSQYRYTNPQTIAPPAGYITGADFILNNTIPHPMYWPYATPDLSKTPPQASPAYAYTIDVYIDGVKQNASPVPLTPSPNGFGAPQVHSLPIPVTLPSANPAQIQIGWLDNENDQDGNNVCTPNLQEVDPDLQINSLQIAS